MLTFEVRFFSDGYIDLDLDNCGGKVFLRVLLNLAMHDYKPLVSGALQLLFRHFSQRQEVLQAFKQVRTRTSSFLAEMREDPKLFSLFCEQNLTFH